MFITVLFTLFLFEFNNAADFNISARDGNQNFTIYEGDVPIVLKVYYIQDDIHGGDCTGACTINTVIRLQPTCNIIDIPGSRHLNILIENRAEMKFTGAWHCQFRPRGITPTEQPIVYFNFNVHVKKVDLSSIPGLPALDDIVEFNITSPDVVNNLTLEEGNQTVVMIITKAREQFSQELCNGWCEMNQKEKINTSSCLMNQLEQSANIKLIFNPLKVTKSHAGSWKCYYIFPSKNGGQPTILDKINVTVNASDSLKDVWLYVAILAGVLVILAIIIGQTVCIIHFKSKAKKAEINKNLTPNKNSDDSPDVRYVKKTSGTGEVRESVIYEALETVRGKAPIPPPIETLPVTPKPARMSRSFSQNNVSVIRDDRTKTSPRIPKNQQNQKKFNTVDRIRSLERIRNRPPLPTPDEIYEVMAPDAQEQTKSGWFQSKTLEKSPLLAKEKKTLYGQSQLQQQDQREPNSPKMGRKTGMPLPGPSRMQAGQGPMGPGLMPGTVRPPTGATAIMGAMPMLPSMIAAAKLRPVKPRPVGDSPSEGFRMAPPPENPGTRGATLRTPQNTPRMQDNIMPQMQDHSRMRGNAYRPQDTPRMQEMPGFRMPDRFPQPSVQDSPRMPGSGFRMPVDPRNDQPFTAPKPGPVPFAKPKPLLPEPEPESYGLEQEPESYYGSSDEEFECYDVLPEYRIYGNAPPKKLQ